MKCSFAQDCDLNRKRSPVCNEERSVGGGGGVGEAEGEEEGEGEEEESEGKELLRQWPTDGESSFLNERICSISR